MNTLREAVGAVLVDLEHYASTHGPGPDRRLADLRAALERPDPVPAIVAALDETEWSPNTLDTVADALRAAGFTFDDPEGCDR